jgi:hypothetical protein
LNEEYEIREQFERRAPKYVTEPPPVDMWGWYFLMKHYGAPTHLLDWTDSALFALFFALNSPVKPPAKKKDQSKILPFGYWIHGGLIERFLMMM